jgi:hypothetical protein
VYVSIYLKLIKNCNYLNIMYMNMDYTNYVNIRNSLLKIERENIKIIGSSQCNVSIEIKREQNEKDIDFLYYIEYFSKNIEYFGNFIKNIEILNLSNEYKNKSKRVSTFNVIGRNNIIIYYKKNNKSDYEFARGKSICKLTKDIVNKIYEKIEISETLLYNLFKFPKEYTYFNDDYGIMYPDFGKFYTDNNILHTLEFPLKKENIKYIYDMTYVVYIKPENYNDIFKLYENGDIINVSVKLKQSSYRHIFYLGKKDLTIFESIYKNIMDVFNIKLGIPLNNIIIKIPLYELRYGIPWIRIFISFRKIEEGYYNINRLMYENNYISLEELIDILNVCENEQLVGDYINGLYNFYIANEMIKEYNLEEFKCLNDQRTTFVNTKLKKKFSPRYNKIMKYQDMVSSMNNISIKNGIFYGIIKEKKITASLAYCKKNVCKINNAIITKHNDIKITVNNCNINGEYQIIKNEGLLDKNYKIMIKNAIIDGEILSEQSYVNFSNYYSWHNDLVIKNKLNPSIQVLRILSIKSQGYNSACTVSACCVLNGQYYIINIIPRTSAYIVNNMDNNFNIIKYLLEDITLENTNFNYNSADYFGESKIHNSLYYLIEIINISPIKCNSCNILKNEPYINTSLYLSQKKLHIKLDENYETSQKLTNCYNKNFIVKLFNIIYNIFRNLYKFRNDDDYIKLKEYVLINLLKVEHNYLIKIGKEVKKNNETIEEKIKREKTYLATELIKKYDKGMFYVSDYEDYPYIANPSRAYNDQNIKILIWYTPLNYNKVELKKVVDRLIELSNSLTSMVLNEKFPEFYAFNQVDIFKNDILYLYKGLENFDEELYFKNYLYNIYGLMGDGDFNDVKKKLDKMIVEVVDYYNIKDDYIVLYHYLTHVYMSTLHLHILTNKSKIDLKIFSSVNTIGYNREDIHEYTKYYFYNYNMLINNVWKYNHTIIISIECVENLIRFIKEYKTIKINQKETSITDLFTQLVIKKRNDITIEEYDNIIKFIFACDNKNITKNYLYFLNETVCGYEYYKSLLSYKNNLKIFIRNILSINKI